MTKMSGKGLRPTQSGRPRSTAAKNRSASERVGAARTKTGKDQRPSAGESEVDYGTTADGQMIDEEMVQRLVDQAEAGFPGVEFTKPKPKPKPKPKTGRPWLAPGAGPSGTRTVRLPEGLDAALLAWAEAEHATPSEVIREALREYLASA